MGIRSAAVKALSLSSSPVDAFHLLSTLRRLHAPDHLSFLPLLGCASSLPLHSALHSLLLHLVFLSHRMREDECYGCVYQREDGTGRVGVLLARELVAVTSNALKTNITTLGPLVLPLSEQLKFLRSLVLRRSCGGGARPYLPDFRRSCGGGARPYLPDFRRALLHSWEFLKYKIVFW
nr:probable 3-ketoacyl-CoA synthase 20 [Setaria viridis]